MTFADPDSVQEVLDAKPHVLDSKTVSVSSLIRSLPVWVSSTVRLEWETARVGGMRCYCLTCCNSTY